MVDSQATSQTAERIKQVLRRDLKLGADRQIPDEMPLFGGDFDLDSLDALLLVTSIEKEFEIKVPNEAVGEEMFANVASLARYVEEKRQGNDSPGAGPAVAVDLDNILNNLPHAEPFKFVTRVASLDPGVSGEGVWRVSGEEAFFAGHFPGQPIVPGVLMAEALAQMSGLVGLSTVNGEAPPAGRLAHFDVRFSSAAEPPVEVVLRSKLTRTLGDLYHFDVEALVGSDVIAKGSLSLSCPKA